jgi:hypothetical protein
MDQTKRQIASAAPSARAADALSEAVKLYLTDLAHEDLKLLVVEFSCVEGLRRQFVSGDALAVLDCFNFCYERGLSLPFWVSETIALAFGRYLDNAAENLDKAFFGTRRGPLADPRRRRHEKRKQRLYLAAAQVASASQAGKQTKRSIALRVRRIFESAGIHLGDKNEAPKSIEELIRRAEAAGVKPYPGDLFWAHMQANDLKADE